MGHECLEQETVHSIASFAEGGDYRGGNDLASQRE
jgi:hypothetical protein